MTVLDDMFPALRTSGLMGRFFPFSMAASMAGSDGLRPLVDDPIFDDLDALLSLSPNRTVTAYERDGAGTAHHSLVWRDEAKDALARGATLELQFVQRHPPIGRWLEDMARELGVPKGARRFCLCTLSPKGAALPMHFDPYEVFSVQLRGEKRWWIAPNDALPFPTRRYCEGLESTAPDQAPATSPRELVHTAKPTPRDMPPDATVLELRPGGVAFIPRGHWHQTEALGPSCALTFAFALPTGISLLREAVARRLEASASWRQPVPATRSEPHRTQERERLAAMLAGLAAEVAAISADELLRLRELPVPESLKS